MTSQKPNSQLGGAIWTVLNSATTTLSRTATLLNSAYNVARYLRNEVELWQEYPLPIWQRIDAWKHGFISRDYVLMDLEHNDMTEYLSSKQQTKYISPAVNTEYSDVLENKIAYHLSTEKAIDAIPTLYGIIESGEFYPTEGHENDILALLDAKGDQIVKPETGTQGRQVYHLSKDTEGYQINDNPCSEKELTDMIGELDGFIVTEYVENHEYARSISPSSVNTIRILTVKDPESGEFFVASAVHRFGNESTGPTDNWSGGGFAAPVDVETGQFGYLRSYSSATGLRQQKRHPESGTRVEGEFIPQWEEIKSTVIQMAEHHRANPYIGWDVVLTEEKPTILEGNCAPHLALQQLGSGLLADARVKRFVETLD